MLCYSEKQGFRITWCLTLFCLHYANSKEGVIAVSKRSDVRQQPPQRASRAPHVRRSWQGTRAKPAPGCHEGEGQENQQSCNFKQSKKQRQLIASCMFASIALWVVSPLGPSAIISSPWVLHCARRDEEECWLGRRAEAEPEHQNIVIPFPQCSALSQPCRCPPLGVALLEPISLALGKLLHAWGSPKTCGCVPPGTEGAPR